MKTQLRLSPAAWPVTASYLAAVITITAITAGWVGVLTGIGLLGLAAALIILNTTRHQLHAVSTDMITVRAEVSVVHRLVNSQHDALIERVDQLVESLKAQGADVPAERRPT